MQLLPQVSLSVDICSNFCIRISECFVAVHPPAARTRHFDVFDVGALAATTPIQRSYRTLCYEQILKFPSDVMCGPAETDWRDQSAAPIRVYLPSLPPLSAYLPILSYASAIVARSLPARPPTLVARGDVVSSSYTSP